MIEKIDDIEQFIIYVEDKTSCIVTIYYNGKANVMVIDSVETKEEYRQMGYGTKLMKKVIETARLKNIDAIELVVNEDSIARKLYAKVGFEETNKIHCRIILNHFKG
jgi:predicted GNAT family acetyltransferase